MSLLVGSDQASKSCVDAVKKLKDSRRSLITQLCAVIPSFGYSSFDRVDSSNTKVRVPLVHSGFWRRCSTVPYGRSDPLSVPLISCLETTSQRLDSPHLRDGLTSHLVFESHQSQKSHRRTRNFARSRGSQQLGRSVASKSAATRMHPIARTHCMATCIELSVRPPRTRE